MGKHPCTSLSLNCSSIIYNTKLNNLSSTTRNHGRHPYHNISMSHLRREVVDTLKRIGGSPEDHAGVSRWGEVALPRRKVTSGLKKNRRRVMACPHGSVGSKILTRTAHWDEGEDPGGDVLPFVGDVPRFRVALIAFLLLLMGPVLTVHTRKRSGVSRKNTGDHLVGGSGEVFVVNLEGDIGANPEEDFEVVTLVVAIVVIFGVDFMVTFMEDIVTTLVEDFAATLVEHIVASFGEVFVAADHHLVEEGGLPQGPGALHGRVPLNGGSTKMSGSLQKRGGEQKVRRTNGKRMTWKHKQRQNGL